MSNGDGFAAPTPGGERVAGGQSSLFRSGPGIWARDRHGATTTATAIPIVLGSGTGAYRGIGGTCKMAVSISEVDPKSKCDTGEYVEAIFITGSGNVSFS